jgi:hypothetical protein
MVRKVEGEKKAKTRKPVRLTPDEHAFVALGAKVLQVARLLSKVMAAVDDAQSVKVEVETADRSVRFEKRSKKEGSDASDS